GLSIHREVEAESPEHLRGARARRRAALAEPRAQRLEDALVPVADELDLDLAESPLDLPALEDGHRVEHHIGDWPSAFVDTDASTPRAERGDRRQLGVARVNVQQAPKLLRNPGRIAGQLQLEASHPPGKLDLPAVPTPLRAASQRHALTGEPVVGCVVVLGN